MFVSKKGWRNFEKIVELARRCSQKIWNYKAFKANYVVAGAILSFLGKVVVSVAAYTQALIFFVFRISKKDNISSFHDVKRP